MLEANLLKIGIVVIFRSAADLILGKRDRDDKKQQQWNNQCDNNK